MATRATYRRGLSFGMLSFFAQATLAFVSGIVIARLYGIEIVGQYALVMAPMSAMWFLSSAREQTALVRELATVDARHPRVTGLFVATLSFSTVLTTLVAGLVLVAVYFLYRGPIDQPELFAPAVAVLVAYVTIENTSWNIDALMSAYRAGPQLFVARTSSTIALLIAAIIAAGFSTSLVSLTIATIVGFAVPFVVRLVLLPQFVRLRVPFSAIRDGYRTLPRMVSFGIRMAPGQIAEGISNEAGVWVIGALQPVTAVGAYSRAWALAGRLRAANYRVTEMLFPTLVERRASGDIAGFDRALFDSIRYAWAFLLIPAATMGGAATGVMNLYGDGFAQGAPALAILLLLPPLTAMVSMLSQVLNAHDRPLMASYVGIGRLVVSLPLTVAMVFLVGITGAAIALVGSYVGSAIALLLISRRHVGAEGARGLWSKTQLLAQLGAYGIGFGTAWVSDTTLAQPFGLVVGLLAGSAAYMSAFVLFGGLNTRDRERFAGLKARLSRGPVGRFGQAVAAHGSALVAGAAVLLVGTLGGALTAFDPLLAVGLALGAVLVAVLLWNLLIGLIAFVVVQFLAVLPVGGGQLTLVKAAGLVLLLTWIATLTRPGERERVRALFHEWGVAASALIFFLAFSGLTFLWAPSPGEVAQDFQRYLLNAVLMAIVISAVMSLRDAKWVAGALAIGGGLSVIGGLLFSVQSGKVGRFAGTVGEANELAVQLIPAAFVGLAFALESRPGLRRTLWAAIALVAVAGIVLTLSRGGMIALIAASAALIVFGGRWRPRLAGAALALGLGAAVTFFSFAPPEQRGRLFALGDSADSSGRNDLWTVGLRAFEEQPIIGSGLGNFTTVTPNFVLEPGRLLRTDVIIDDPTISHNVYLGLAVEVGVIGLTAFLVFAAASFLAAVFAARRFNAIGDAGGEILSRAIAASVFGYFVAAFFISLQFQNTLWVLLGLSVTLLIVARRQQERASPLPARGPLGRPGTIEPPVPVR